MNMPHISREDGYKSASTEIMMDRMANRAAKAVAFA
jgi:hypothetical protein